MKTSLITSISMALIFSLILITGCSLVYPTTSVKDYNVGKEGVVVEFSELNPASVYEQEDFGNYIYVNNKGSYDVTPRRRRGK